ncbi:glutamate--tRNA ligase family protein [Bifidobacterium sp. ESL0775]|uniref:glutamate--tRNA ligase family protein n=1 Tax=Bifidobacterium sp. ESL0775 TaxID=2983230 RepID=UPI0023F9BDE3|nr:glutamate--tRNA ligase family protein [Bifidobacterium sp. ESL0775]WEV70144.1 glutamate--tRNA ligase family protein [Bifidobacterium sp. ESL0775]
MHIGNVYAMLAAWLSAHAGDRSGEGGGNGRDGDGDGQCGKVLLRIEDVDGPRAVKDADKWIMDDLHWLGLDWDGKPVYQSQRTEIYEEALRSLESMSLDDVIDDDSYHCETDIFNGLGSGSGANGLDDKGNEATRGCGEYPDTARSSSWNNVASSSDFPLVYPCFCSRADLRAASAPQEGDRFLIYPGTCRKLLAKQPDEVRSRLEAGQRHSWRIAVPEESSWGSVVTFDDRIFGHQGFDLPREVGDTVIRRSDGIFSYQLAVVVDDLLMGVNDIVRGRDLLRSTALQIWIRRALIASGFAAKYGVEQVDGPAYAHLPLIDDPTGTRLAKRKHSLDIGTLRADGVKPEQVIGYCAWLLGIRGPRDVHMPDASGPVAMSAREALEYFTFDDIRADKSDRILNPNWTDVFDRRENGSVA